MGLSVGMVSLGCPKNQVDGEIMLSLLEKGGYEITADETKADVIIINTCGFIADAKKEAIENIIEVGELKKSANLKSLIVTGCMAERYRDEILKEMPEVDAVVGIGENQNICAIVEKSLKGCPYSVYGEKNDLVMDSDRILTSPNYTAYLRIADGCDNCCTYCAIPMIRGHFRSRKIESVVEEAETLVKNGTKELILIAQDTTRYGEDIYGKYMLAPLLDELQKIDNLKWIRILYTYPDKITDELLESISRNDKVLHYLDIPLQHASQKVLRRMGRKGDFDSLCTLINNIRTKIHDITIRTTFIVGFPGEDEDDFEQLARFTKEMKFNRMGCFTYSAEEGTPAAEFDDQIDEDVKARRQEILMAEQSYVNDDIAESFIGKTFETLVEGYDSMNKCYYGRTRMDAPDIDGKIFFMKKQDDGTEIDCNDGDIVLVKVYDLVDYDLLGEVVK